MDWLTDNKVKELQQIMQAVGKEMTFEETREFGQNLILMQNELLEDELKKFERPRPLLEINKKDVYAKNSS